MEGGRWKVGRWECTRPLRSLPLINGCRGTGLAARSLRPVCARLDLKGLGGGKVARTLMLEAPRDLLSHAGARKCTGRPTSETLHAPAQCPSRGSGDSYLLFTRSENDSLASCLLPLASRLSPLASRLLPHASRLLPHASCLLPLASRLTPHVSYPAYRYNSPGCKRWQRINGARRSSSSKSIPDDTRLPANKSL